MLVACQRDAMVLVLACIKMHLFSVNICDHILEKISLEVVLSPVLSKIIA